MSNGVAEGQGEHTEGRLRRSRWRKIVTPVLVESSSSRESIESEAETLVDWNSRGDTESPDGVVNLGEYSNETQVESSTNEMSKRDAESKDSGVGQGPDLNEFMRMFFEDQKRRDDKEKERRDEERKEREVERREREEANRARDELLFASMRDVRPTLPAPVPTPIAELPRMKEADDIESFIPIFEASLRMNGVPCESWKAKLTSHLPLKTLVPVENVLHSGDSSYGDLVDALMGCSTLSFCSAAEDMCSGERGRLWEMEVRASMTKLKQVW